MINPPRAKQEVQDCTCPTPYCHDGTPDPIVSLVVVPAVVRVQKDYGRGSYYQQEEKKGEEERLGASPCGHAPPSCRGNVIM